MDFFSQVPQRSKTIPKKKFNNWTAFPTLSLGFLDWRSVDLSEDMEDMDVVRVLDWSVIFEIMRGNLSVILWRKSKEQGNNTSNDSDYRFQSVASDLLVDGAFNINSTSVDAWKAQLSSLRGIPVYKLAQLH